MPTILEAIRFSAQNLDFLSPERLEQRAKLVAADFTVVGLAHRIGCLEYPVPQYRMRLPYGYYELLGSECSVDNAGSGDRRHVAMSGGGLNQECLLYYSKVSEWAHAHIPQLWPKALRDELRDPNQHLNTVCEVWWLDRLIGADFSTIKYSVPVDPNKPAGKNYDWEVQLPGTGITMRMEVKRRVGDIGRSIDVPHLKWKSIFHDLEKFPPASPPNQLNVGCVRLFAPISNEVLLATEKWLQSNPGVSAVALHSPAPGDGEPFAVVTQPGLEYIKLLFRPPDLEDNTYIAPFCYARDIPELDLPRVEPRPVKPTARRS